MATDHTDVMISSTARDLPDHRKQASDACLRMGMFPIGMEQLPALDADAISVSLKMVDDAEIYVGIFAHRYGYVPKDGNPAQISITEMEYNRAVERKIPRLIFFMHEDHAIKAGDVETGDGAVKLKALKDKIGVERVAGFFKSPEDLRGLMIHSLSQYRKSDTATLNPLWTDIPAPPKEYIAHPYTLLQSSQVIGRQAELNLLTDWVANPRAPVYQARMLNFVAIGGMGKSALTWKWFNDIAPQEMRPLAGRLWWSFYEGGTDFERFISRALAYVSGRPADEIDKLPPPERESRLLAILDREPYLLVLDGLERVLIAYARMDAAHLADDEYDERTANRVAGAIGLPESAAQSFIGQHQLRKTADPRAGAFLRKLATVRAARILVSTRLYPADLQTVTGHPAPGCFAFFLHGLTDDDALSLWRAMGVSGSREGLLPLFRRFDNYPLLIRALAGEVAKSHRAAGDFDVWRRQNPNFDPLRLPLVQVKSHVLQFAMQDLDPKARKLLETVAAFRMPASYDTLVALLVGEALTPGPSPAGRGVKDPAPPAPLPQRGEALTPGPSPEGEGSNGDSQVPLPAGEGFRVRAKPFPTEHDLDDALTDLEDRGLLGWDKAKNRYDLHPVVRGMCWQTLNEDGKRGVYEALHGHFQAVPEIDQNKVERLDDLGPAIELYNTLIGLGHYDEAGQLFHDRLSSTTLHRLSAARQRAELLEMLFPDGLDKLPRRAKTDGQAFTLNALALAYKFSGQPGRAAPLYRRQIVIREQEGAKKGISTGLRNLSSALRLAGALREAESAARRALVIDRERADRFLEAVSLRWLGMALAVRAALTPGPSPAGRGVEDPSPSATLPLRGEGEEALTPATRLRRVPAPEGQGSERDSQVPRPAGEGFRVRASLQRALRIWIDQDDIQGQGLVNAYLAQAALWAGDFAAARTHADRAWELAHVRRNERDFIRAARAQGAAALGLGDLDTADERLHHALARARAVNYAEQELPALVGLADLARRRGDPATARERLDEVWEGAERGPYPPFHADALNVLAQIERDAGNREAAIKAATEAYTKAWCDGEPFAYARGLYDARAHLAALGAREPVLPPFDESKFEPMPEVEIDPADEYGAKG